MLLFFLTEELLVPKKDIQKIINDYPNSLVEFLISKIPKKYKVNFDLIKKRIEDKMANYYKIKI